MFKRRPEYFAVAALGGIMTIAASVFMAMSLDSGISEPDRRSMKKADEIVVRAASLTGSSDEEVKIAKAHVEDGLISCGDYVISVMTSPEYLLQNISDEQFASDLCYVINGSSDQGEIADIMDDLKDHSRVVAIDNAIRSEDSDLKVSGNPSGKGSVISDVSLATSIDAPGQYTVGIKETTGSYTATGDEVRTDFFVDGSLFYGYLKYDDNASKNGYREFVLSWDTADCAPGTHEVYALLRSSDGRGTVISGGEITIPEKLAITPGSVAESNIPAGRNNSWYIIDCADDNCYINFAGLSADIKVSLYLSLIHI